MKFAYADPPYLGCAAKFYGHLHHEAAEYDRIETHAALIARLCDEFSDGWAMSLHSPSLKRILAICPDDVRVMAWVKPFASFKPGVNPGYCWEPLIVRGGRARGRDMLTVRDYVSCSIAMKRGFPGAKPLGFCFWVFDVLGATASDELVDMFPGSGAVGRAWKQWRAQQRIA